jgi:hypothetical protein
MHSARLGFTTLVAALAVGGASASPSHQGEKIRLRLNLSLNQRFEYVIKLNIKGDETMGSLGATMHFADRVKDVNNDFFTQSVYCAGMSMTATGMLEAAKESLAGLKGVSFEKEVGSNGKATKVAGISAIAFGTAVDLLLPSKPVGVGDTWTDTVSPNEQLGKLDVTYRLASFDASTATIEATIEKTESVEMAKPYIFIVDRATGRYRYSKGNLIASTAGVKFGVDYELMMIAPHNLRFVPKETR